MHRIFKKFTVLCLICSALSGMAMPAFANKHDVSEINDGYKKEYAYDVYRWWQGEIPFDRSNIIPNSSSSESLYSACSYFATSYMLVKMGLLKPYKKETPITFIDKAREIEAYASSWGLFDFERLSEIYPEIEVVDTFYNTQKMTYEEVKNEIKVRMGKGEFVIACVAGSDTNGHYIFVDGFNEDDEMVIGDSTRAGTKWTDTYGAEGHNNKIVHIETFKCKKKRPFHCPSIYDDKLSLGNEEDEKE